MCTVMTVDHEHLLGRTMDFPPRTPWHLTYLPQGYQWRAANMLTTYCNQRALLGGMRVYDGHYLVGDGFNDAGLAVAELFFPVEADYPTTVRSGTNGLTPQDFIMWALGNHATVSELAADLDRVTVIDALWYDHQRYPFHWLVMDKTGTYVIEPLVEHLHVRPNPLAVFTNTPSLDEQLEKLATYLGQSSTASVSQLMSAAASTCKPLPTGGNSVQRFIKAAICRWKKVPQSVVELRNFLQSVTVPNSPAHSHNYTHYQAVIDLANLRYDFYDLHSGMIVSHDLPRLMREYPRTPRRFE
ncbi:MAG: linear amide C-N hydrolase [Lactobacillaceae bacterium]|nr:linear amide C-N hydrolase [Lactobacillaceae bacterium]